MDEAMQSVKKYFISSRKSCKFFLSFSFHLNLWLTKYLDEILAVLRFFTHPMSVRFKFKQDPYTEAARQTNKRHKHFCYEILKIFV